MNALDLGLETEKILQCLGQYGQEEGGGVTRLLYSPEWVLAQQWVEKMMRQEGWKVNYDAVGNLFGRLEGSKFKNETILTGSHVDTVRNGGIYDGQYGIVAGIVALKHLKEKYGPPLRNIEVVSFAEEEGSRFPYVFWGVKNFFSLARRQDMEQLVDDKGISFVEAMKQAGFDFKNEAEKVRQDVKAFLEVHIEQGGVLEIEKKSVGVVTDIAGQWRFIIEITGEANHAGTTPMAYRKDSLHAAGSVICALIELAKSYGDPMVATVGKLEVTPNVSNVVPGKTVFTLDTRHTDAARLKAFTEEATDKMKNIAADMGVEISVNMWMDGAPTPMDRRLVDILVKHCRENGLKFKKMHSGAGHDSQIMAQFVPTAMVFAPSHMGISHSPLEYTAPQDLGEGIRALMGALYELAYTE